MKIQPSKVDFCVKYKCKRRTRKGEKKSIHFVSRCLANGRKKYQGGLDSAWSAFLFNVFHSMGYLRRWGKLFHAKEPQKEKLVLKISVLVLGKNCLFPWTRRRSKGITRSFRYCRALLWTTFCIRTHLRMQMTEASAALAGWSRERRGGVWGWGRAWEKE